MNLKERFESRSIPEPNSGCSLWVGHIDKHGYGKLGKRLAHRVAYELARGAVPDGMYVCHKCDVRACVNPDHLWLGTHQDNMDDMSAKGRARYVAPRQPRRGERSPRAKLRDETVLEIRLDRRPQRQIAAEYGVARSLICRIKSGQSWKHLPMEASA